MSAIHRRSFMQSAGAGLAALGLDLSFLKGLPAVSAADAQLDPKLVRLRSDIEPLVRLLEETPRDRLLEEVGGRVKKGLSYREVLTALQLAGVRNVQPRPNVGFKFHAVLVVNSAHLASLAGPDQERWLPIFWSLDYFKASQAATLKESGWRMGPVDEAKLPPPHQARQAFIDAMTNWDEAAADVAVAALARTGSANEVYELFFWLGSRDFRSIGHKAIFVANSFRTLQAIGWQHAEPILRSLAYALLNHEGDNPAKRDGEPDRPGRQNAERVRKIRPEWQDGKPAPSATVELLATLRDASAEDACNQVVELLNKGVAVQSIWDGVLAGGAELLMRQPGIVALHALTTSNAVKFAFDTSASEETRRWLLLQNVAFVPLFREAMKGRGKVGDARIDRLEPLPVQSGAEAIGEIFADVSRDRLTAARKALGWLKDHPQPQPLLDAARLLVFLKGTDSHDYKFSSAVLEDALTLSPGWRDSYLAASLFQLRGAGERTVPLVERTRAALRA